MTDPLSLKKEFAALLDQGEEMDLGRAALLVAQEEYLLLDINYYLTVLKNLAKRVDKILLNREDPRACVAAMNRVLFEEEGFVGNQEDYYDPRNSFLNEVLDRRVGIPISLCLLYMDVGRRVGLPLVGVGLPGHFIVRLLAKEKSFNIDPFDQGRFLTDQDCRGKVLKIYGERMPFRPEHLKPVSHKSILSRLLYNLKNIYVESKSFAKALTVVEKLVMIDPQNWQEVRDRGIIYYELKRYPDALADIECYMRWVSEAEDRKDLLQLADLIGKRMKEN